jgi:hypothetical protein
VKKHKQHAWGGERPRDDQAFARCPKVLVGLILPRLLLDRFLLRGVSQALDKADDPFSGLPAGLDDNGGLFGQKVHYGGINARKPGQARLDAARAPRARHPADLEFASYRLL